MNDALRQTLQPNGAATAPLQQVSVDVGSGVTVEMIAIPGGTFLMGAPTHEESSRNEERPQHRVTVAPFYLGKFPVTQAQWEAVMGNNPSKFKGANHPVEQVTWNECQEFLQKLNGGGQNIRSVEEVGSVVFRLPSESEWEYACRAGAATPFYFGNTISTEQANYDGNYTYGQGVKGVYRQETTDVGSFAPNAFGLYDMHGNVWEWCADTWHENYRGAPDNGSAWGSVDDKKNKALRGGGSWYNTPHRCRSAYRDVGVPFIRSSYVGFRLAGSTTF